MCFLCNIIISEWFKSSETGFIVYLQSCRMDFENAKTYISSYKQHLSKNW